MIEAYPLCWPEGWKRTPASVRTRARFSKGARQYASAGGGSWVRHQEISVADGVKRVREQLDRLIVYNDWVISTNLKLRLDGLPLSNQREPEDPGVAVYWRRSGEQTPRCMAIDRYDRVADNLAAIAATLEAMRAIERHGGAEILERTFTGFTALPAPGQTTAPSWRTVLDFAADARLTRADVDERYRLLRSRAHPDKGGTTEQFNAVQAAYEQACMEVT